MNYEKLQTIRKAFKDAMIARDAIENCFSKEWRDAHHRATAAWRDLDQEIRTLAKEDRLGAWATVGEREMMIKGYL